MKGAVFAALTAAALIIPSNTAFAADSGSASGFALKYEIKDKQVTVTGCTGKTTALNIPAEIEGLPVTSVAENAFAGNGDITSCVLPDSIKSVGAKAFSTCPRLGSVTIGKNVASIGDYAFTACPVLSSVTVSTGNASYSSTGGCLYSGGDTLILYAGGVNAVISDKTRIVGKGAFFGRTNIVSVTFPKSVTALGDYAFSGCLSLKSADIPDSVTSLGKGCFMSCNALESADLGASLKTVPENCFHSCNSLEKVNIPDSITAIEENAFYSCTALGELYIPSSVTSIGRDAVGRKYDVRSSSSENVQDFVISGKSGSAAEKYAAEYKLGFKYVSCKKGDVNGDSFTDAVDASAVLAEYARISSGKSASFGSEQKKAADWNDDGITDAVDASGILAEYARLSSKKTA